MEKHISYEETLQRPCDFIVNYRLLSEEEGGRKTGNPPYQGYRSDFRYEGDDEHIAYIIFPEFLDDDNNLIKRQVQNNGKAKMWIVSDRMIEYHKNRLKIGTKGFFVEGFKKTAECEVIQIF